MYTKFYDNTITTKFIKNLVSKTNVPFISTWKPGDFVIRGMLYLTRDAIWKCQHTGFPKSVDDVCTEDTHRATLYKETTNGNIKPLGRTTDESIRFFTRVSPYVFGEEYFNITGKYTSNVLGYDATTHFYLGLYLRMMRDVYDLDLMPFYNCYCDEVVTDIDFNTEADVSIISGKKFKQSPYKYLSVPVKFGKSYMLAINNELPTEVMCVFYSKKGISLNLTKILNDKYTDVKTEVPTTYKKFLRLQFKNPVLYETPSWKQIYNAYLATTLGTIDYTKNIDGYIETIRGDEKYDLVLGQFEKNLRLIIKMPKNNKSSVVVIEGDYPVVNCTASEDYSNRYNNATWNNKYLENTTINSKTVTGEWIRPEVIRSYPEKASEDDKPILADDNNTKVNTMTTYLDPDTGKLCISYNETNVTNKLNDPVVNKEPLFSPLGLLQISDGNTYAFSNRLVEFLTQNAINHLDSFGKNIERVQQYSKSDINLIKNNSRYTGILVPGVWDEDFLRYLFNLTRDTKLDIHKVDLTGYVDRDIEKVISRGLNQL